MQPVQLSLIPDPLPTTTAQPLPVRPMAMVEHLPAEAVAAAIVLLAGVIAKAVASATGVEVSGDE